eukprot:comp15309_c0_seq1/m.12152 comp15309_c0_seq1/g.12152  ORF comp15309_c0_seq1/g.12152 comp15309_c0_seq1/m.12152 type:complete len:515 (-) comp15309_c0_seq1:173-1717(-)
MEYMQPTAPQQQMILCCQCGIPIPPNPANMCINCIRSSVDVTEGIQKQVALYFCRGCDRYLQPPAIWVTAALESRELLAICLKRLKGLNKVRLVDATFVWTEPHSKRLKVRLVIQKEVFASTILQQDFIVEYVVNHQMCDSCHRNNAKDHWNAVVQLRQKVDHKKTFFFLEQLIIKHQAHTKTVNVKESKDGLDFFFASKNDALKMADFLGTVAPCRMKKSERLISSDVHNNTANFKFTFSLEIMPVCKEDLIVLPRKLAKSMGNISPLVVCTKVHASATLIDPLTLQVEECSNNLYWRGPVLPLCSYKQQIEYTVLDIELLGPTRGRYALAEAEVARSRDFGKNDHTFRTITHLGNLLKPGDTCMGYDLAYINANNTNFDMLNSDRLPDVVLVKKSYPNRRKTNSKRKWKLATLSKEQEGIGKKDAEKAAEDYEMFMRDLEEDKEYRANVNIYKDPNADLGAQSMGGADEEPEEDFPEVELEEMMDALTLDDTVPTEVAPVQHHDDVQDMMMD